MLPSLAFERIGEFYDILPNKTDKTYDSFLQVLTDLAQTAGLKKNLIEC